MLSLSFVFHLHKGHFVFSETKALDCIKISFISLTQSGSKTKALDCSKINLEGHVPVEFLNVNDENTLIPGYC